MARLKTRYNDELKAQLLETLGVKNVMEIPRITKITINMGVGAAAAFELWLNVFTFERSIFELSSKVRPFDLFSLKI